MRRDRATPGVTARTGALSTRHGRPAETLPWRRCGFEVAGFRFPAPGAQWLLKFLYLNDSSTGIANAVVAVVTTAGTIPTNSDDNLNSQSFQFVFARLQEADIQGNRIVWRGEVPVQSLTDFAWAPGQFVWAVVYEFVGPDPQPLLGAVRLL